RLEPDLAFRHADTFPFLLDAKYKRLNPRDAHLGVSTSDIYQMHAYARRYDCPRVLLLYPQTADTPAPLSARFTLHGGSVVAAATVNLSVPLDQAQGRAALADELKRLLEETEPV
ncbi:MAG TPA: hypothetical protein VK388_18435, partial [Pyrinomonadaceae bacterium]|nr:hypothetical protein [Pyrinomonadaceae bacterium]